MGLLDRARSKAEATAWKPEPGEGIEGVVSSVSTLVGYEGAHYKALTIEATDETSGVVTYHTAHCFHGVLAQEVEDVLAGDSIGIVYLGIPPKKKYHSYAVVVDRLPRAGEVAALPELPETVALAENPFDADRPF